jgi:serine/threonine-protein kinase RsbW
MSPDAGRDQAAVPARLQLRVGNRLAALEPTRLAVLEFLSPYELSARAIYGVELVLEEVLVNAIAYAFPAGGDHAIELTVEIQPEALLMQFDDDGVAFDPVRAPAPAAPKAISQAAPGGHGLQLVRKFAIAASYQRSRGRNRLVVSLARA